MVSLETLPTETSAKRKWEWIRNQVLSSLAEVLEDDEVGPDSDRVVMAILDAARRHRYEPNQTNDTE